MVTPASPGHVSRIPLLGVNREEEDFVSPYDRRSQVYRHLAYEHVKEHPPEVRQPLWTVPNILTFLRLLLVPVLMVVWYIGSPSAPLTAAVLFVIASLTDWLDGYIARRVSSTVQPYMQYPASLCLQYKPHGRELPLLGTAPSAPVPCTAV